MSKCNEKFYCQYSLSYRKIHGFSNRTWQLPTLPKHQLIFSKKWSRAGWFRFVRTLSCQWGHLILLTAIFPLWLRKNKVYRYRGINWRLHYGKKLSQNHKESNREFQENSAVKCWKWGPKFRRFNFQYKTILFIK